jgi:hypothetical protein
MVSFVVIFMLIVWRIIMFYIRYAIFYRWIRILLLSIFEPSTRGFINQFLNVRNVNYLFWEFSPELGLIIFALITRNQLLSYIQKSRVSQSQNLDVSETFDELDNVLDGGNKTYLAQLEEKQAEQSFTDQKSSKTTECKTLGVTHFICWFIILDTMALPIFFTVYINHLTAFKVCSLLCIVLYLNLLFINFSNIAKTFKFTDICELKLKYFYQSFIKKISTSALLDQEKDLPENFDHEINKKYNSQLLTKIELEILRNARTFWPFFFYPLLIYNVCLLTFYLIGPIVGPAWSKYISFILLSRDVVSPEDIVVDMNSVQCVLGFLIIKYLILDWYSDLNISDIEMGNLELTNIVNLIHNKYTYYISLLEDIYDPDMLEEQEERFLHSLHVFHEGNQEFLEEIRDANLASPNVSSCELDRQDSSHDCSSESISCYNEKCIDDGLGNFSFDSEDTEEKKPTAESLPQRTEYICQRTSKKHKLVYLMINTNKYYLIKYYYNMVFTVRRLSLVPIYFSIVHGIDITLPFLSILVIVHQWKLNKNFTWMIKFYLPTFSAIWMLRILAICIGTNLTADRNKEEGIWLNLTSPDNPYIVVILSAVFIMYPIGWTVCICCSRFMTNSLFVVKMDADSIFDYPLLENRQGTPGETGLMIDYQKWLNGYSCFHRQLFEFWSIWGNQFFIVILCTLLLQTTTGIPIFVIPILVGIEIREIAMAKAKMVYIAPEASMGKNILYFGPVVFIILTDVVWKTWKIFIYVFHYTSIEIRKGVARADIKDTKEGLILSLVVMMSYVFIDNINDMHFLDDSRLVRSKARLRNKYAAMAAAYDFNEAKLYSRVVEAMKKKELDDMMDSILLDPNGQVSISKFNCRYWQQDIREKIGNWMDKLKKKTQLLSPKSMYFKFLASHSNEYLWHPLPYLALCVIAKKNKNVLKDVCSWDIEKLFVKDLSFYEDIFQRVTSYYQKIQEKGPTDRN